MPGTCPRCKREVYFAEQRLALGKVWHVFCFSCRNCCKLLDSCSVVTHSGELYCKNCYSRFPSINLRSNRSVKTPDSFTEEDSRKELRLRGGGTGFAIASCKETNEWFHQLRGEQQQENAERSQLTSDRGFKAAGRVPLNTEKDKFYTNSASASSTETAIIPSRRKLVHPPTPPRRSPLPSRRRVSFCDVVFEEKRCAQRPGSYDVWRADEQSQDGRCVDYLSTSSTSRVDRQPSVRFLEDTSCCKDIEKEREEIQEDDLGGCQPAVHEVQRGSVAGSRGIGGMTEDNQGTVSNESLPGNDRGVIQDSPSAEELDEDGRMRGGCGGFRYPGHRPGSSGNSRKMEAGSCCAEILKCSKCKPDSYSQRRGIEDGCGFPSSCTGSLQCVDRYACCFKELPACRKAPVRCNPPCIPERQGCGAGGGCGSGCRGGCGKPGQTCSPAKPCPVLPCKGHSSASWSCASCCRPRKTGCSTECDWCAIPRPGKCATCRSYCRPKSPGPRFKGCCNEGPRFPADSAAGSCCCQRSAPGCDCLGGGLDCQRCGRKVYHAEMQMVSGAPYHNICFSCFCCRKPLEPLTYQENSGEIYCKQCYVRNFGPQGYGYGAGAGALQTPL